MYERHHANQLQVTNRLLDLLGHFAKGSQEAQVAAQKASDAALGQAAESVGKANALTGLIAGAAACMLLLSDARLKRNVRRVPGGALLGGCRVYDWEWSQEARAFGLCGRSRGVLAQEVAVLRPGAVRTGSDGF